ncbi:hypothetical protein [Carboxylicivirga linearis]|uniref:DUF1579 domain-containing protein n=1 Tax=Carboxylicivirga linearis TaxID=1628157 RepID=A0ABS5K2Q8_9BACT|nr:hypothetical protein [Carboxylicivirga linearis]MBS2100951.1 hypothetical protein [Carboxylicivirga linearis]
MKQIILTLVCLVFIVQLGQSQDNKFKRLEFLLGNWHGTGSGFGNNNSVIESSFNLVMDNNYIEVSNESKFEPTEKNPEGEHHIDKGFISFDKTRSAIVFRQFNSEGYYNQYVLVDSLSNDTTLVFNTEFIENFVPGGKARWIIKKLSETEIETTFDVSFPNKEYTCFGTNKLTKQ